MKNIVIIALVCICSFFAYKLYTVQKIDSSAQRIAQSARETVKAEVETIQKKVDEKGIEHAIIDDEKQVIASIYQLDTISAKMVDSLTKALGIATKQVHSLTSTIARLEADNLKATNQGDTLYSYEDRFAHIQFNRPAETFSLQYDAEVNLAEYWKRDGFLAPRKRYLEIWMTDPRATINGISRLRFEPSTRNRITLKGIGEYNGKYKEAYFGGGLELESGRFEYSGNYLYDFNTHTWFPSIRVGMKLVEF